MLSCVVASFTLDLFRQGKLSEGADMVLLHPRLFILWRSFGALNGPKGLALPSNTELSFDELHDFLVVLAQDEHFKEYPPSNQFQRIWWKWAVLSLEERLSENEHSDREVRFKLTPATMPD